VGEDGKKSVEAVSAQAWRSQELTKLLHGQTRVARDTTHGERVDRVVARDRHDALSVAHDDVLSLAHEPEAGFLECAYGVQVIDARDLGQGLDDHFDLADVLAPELLVDNGQILADRVFDAL
jgi:hypothetical protein